MGKDKAIPEVSVKNDCFFVGSYKIGKIEDDGTDIYLLTLTSGGYWQKYTDYMYPRNKALMQGTKSLVKKFMIARRDSDREVVVVDEDNYRQSFYVDDLIDAVAEEIKRERDEKKKENTK